MGDAPRPHPAPVSGHSSHGPARARLGHRRAANNRATLALPELLKRNPQAKGKEEPEPIAEAKPLTMPKPTMADGTAIARFMLACLPRAKGQEVEARTIYARFSRWCDAQVPPLAPLAPSDFAAAFKAWCERGNIRVRRDGGKIYCQDVRLVA